MTEQDRELPKKPRIVQFEDLIAWQRARQLSKAIYIASSATAAVSVMSNIAEGFERSSRPDFHPFLTIAKASCAEVRSQLYVAWDVGYMDEGDFYRLRDLTQDASRIIGALKSAVQKQRKR